MLFGISLKEYVSNFLRDFFFFANLVKRSNGWLNAVAYMIRLKENQNHLKYKVYFVVITLKLI
jgi:hypothetical protein